MITNPTNLPQDATGGRTATWGSMFKFFGAKTLSTGASAVDRFEGRYSSSANTIEGTLLMGIA